MAAFFLIGDLPEPVLKLEASSDFLSYTLGLTSSMITILLLLPVSCLTSAGMLRIGRKAPVYGFEL